LKSKDIEIKNEHNLLAKWELAPMMTLSATIRTFFQFIQNQLIHFVIDLCRCWSSRSLVWR